MHRQASPPGRLTHSDQAYQADGSANVRGLVETVGKRGHSYPSDSPINRCDPAVFARLGTEAPEPDAQRGVKEIAHGA
jgi:hypothetical protein